MDEIKRRLKQLEDVETGLLAERQATIQRRLREDEALHLKRKEEDQTYSQSLKERDQEEDVSDLNKISTAEAEIDQLSPGVAPATARIESLLHLQFDAQ